MILTCPACATQYRLKDGAIPPEGRTVRCASCKHKWHQDGDAGAVDQGAAQDAGGQWPVGGAEDLGGPPQPDADHAEQALAEIPEAAAHEQMIAETPEPALPDDRGADDYRPNDGARASDEYDAAAAPAPAAWPEPNDAYAAEDQGFAAIPAMHDEDEPRGGKLKWIAALVLVVIIAAAAFWFLAPPELKARAGIAQAGESPLEVIVTTKDRQRLASGNELLAISGRVINSTEHEQAVPPIHAELRDAKNKLVYQWTIAPPARSLAPGAAASFNSAEVDVPAGADILSLRFAS